MVNRRTTKFSHLAEQESITSFLRSENQSLRRKNEDLAKALSDAKIEQQKLVQNSLELQKRLYSTDVEKLKYEEFLRAQSIEMQNYIQQYFLLMEGMTTMLGRIKMFVHSPQALDQFISGPPERNSSTTSTPSSKTMAVMPMISGHTILSPKVNLPRVTVKQLTDMMHTTHSELIENGNMESDEIEFADNVSSNQEDLSEGSFENDSLQPNRRLETVQEDATEEEQSISNSHPLLSGVFKDIQVFISPLSPQHLIKFKHRTPRKLGQNSFSTTSSSSVRSPVNSTGDNSTLTATKGSMSGSVSTTESSSNETQIKNSTTPLPTKFNNLFNTNTEDYDPMEGPSNLRRYTQDVNAAIFKPAPNETSTPYSPQISQSKSGVSSDEPETPTRSLKHVTKRKASSKRDTTSSRLSNCCVRLQKLSQNALNSLSSSSSKNDIVSPKKLTKLTRKGRNLELPASSSTEDETASPKKEFARRSRDDSPTVLERSRRSGSDMGVNERGRRTASSPLGSPKARRTRRKLTPGSYKEPSLNKKMRR